MKKHLWLLFILILLIGCGPSGGRETAVESQQPTTTATAVAPATQPPTPKPEQTTGNSGDHLITTFPATTLDEAAVIRERDWVHGATDPAVTIIEYGDFQ